MSWFLLGLLGGFGFLSYAVIRKLGLAVYIDILKSVFKKKED